MDILVFVAVTCELLQKYVVCVLICYNVSLNWCKGGLMLFKMETIALCRISCNFDISCRCALTTC